MRLGLIVSTTIAALALGATGAMAHPASFAAVGTQYRFTPTAKGFDFRERVRRGNATIATDRVTCLNRQQDMAVCSGVFTFRDGSTLRVRGTVSLVATSTISIVGGTKRYRGARGKLTLAHLSSTKTVESFTFS